MDRKLKAKLFFEEMQNLKNAHHQDRMALEAQYLQAINSRQIDFQKQTKTLVESFERETQTRLNEIESLLRESFVQNKKPKVGFEIYRPVDEVCERKKYFDQIPVQLEHVRRQRKGQLQILEAERLRKHKAEIEKLKRNQEAEKKKLLQRQEAMINQCMHQHKQQMQKQK